MRTCRLLLPLERSAQNSLQSKSLSWKLPAVRWDGINTKKCGRVGNLQSCPQRKGLEKWPDGVMSAKIEQCYIYLLGAQPLSRVQLFETPWTVAGQAPLSMGFSWQESRSRLPFPPLGNLLDPGIEPRSLVSPALVGRFFTTAPPGKLLIQYRHSVMSNSLRPHGLYHASPPCPSPTPGAYSNSCPLSR